MPIIGHGDIASVITDRPDVTFMASGVSNSRCTDIDRYHRENQLLFKQPKDVHLVYFSSLCIYYADTMYSNHKRATEQMIINRFQSYTIIRIGNIDWGKNPNTLINYLRSNPDAKIQNTYRHVISLDEFKYWINLIIVPGKDIMNIPGKMWYVPDLVESFGMPKNLW